MSSSKRQKYSLGPMEPRRHRRDRFNGNSVSLDSMDGTSGFWVKFAIGKAIGGNVAATRALRPPAMAANQSAALHSALSLMEGQII